MDRWLDTIEPRQFDEWMAFDRLEPDPLDRIREVLKLGFAAVCRVSGFGADVQPEQLDPVTREKTGLGIVSPDRAVSVLRSVHEF